MAGCGDESTSSESADGSTAVQPSSSPEETLTIKVKPSPDAPATTWNLTCDPPGGTHPKAAEACAALAETADPFKPVTTEICTKIYGGPATATVQGTWRGSKVDTAFSREDGCQLHRWTEVAPLFGDVPKPG
ncbi:SSI family serine proteinase inhibitor [Actinomadura rifamycini]|uniref:SSI family serine proteinase inhibitor n=1 Tax=Actinomadura rifamycini TaxID=31962 RepID=UPI001FDF01AB|nr:SSI family serine proteinase inhibitor [Actinomadura rifamycini]